MGFLMGTEQKIDSPYDFRQTAGGYQFGHIEHSEIIGVGRFDTFLVMGERLETYPTLDEAIAAADRYWAGKFWESGKTKRFTYGCMSRPPVWECVPEIESAVVNALDLRGNYGTITYPRPLTPREIYKYDLDPVDPIPAMPLYPEGTKVKDMRTGKVSAIEFFDGDYCFNDERLQSAFDWRWYEPVAEDAK